MKNISKILNFLNLLDYSGEKLSISNLLVYVLGMKICISSPNMDWSVVSGLLVVLLNYSHKRFQASQVPIEAPQVDLEPIYEELKVLSEQSAEALDKAQKVALSLGLKQQVR